MRRFLLLIVFAGIISGGARAGNPPRNPEYERRCEIATRLYRGRLNAIEELERRNPRYCNGRRDRWIAARNYDQRMREAERWLTVRRRNGDEACDSPSQPSRACTPTIRFEPCQDEEPVEVCLPTTRRVETRRAYPYRDRDESRHEDRERYRDESCDTRPRISRGTKNTIIGAALLLGAISIIDRKSHSGSTREPFYHEPRGGSPYCSPAR